MDHTITFDWDPIKDTSNQQKHGVSFTEAQYAFLDPHRIIAPDEKHSAVEKRFFCLGRIHGKIMTVRFTMRGQVVRIIGAGYWREGKAIYEQAHES